MELRQLEYFLAVSKYQNFTRAAQVLHVSQPSITNAIQKLEGELGVKLFDRSIKKIALTEEGSIFQKRVEKILYDLKEAIFEVRDFNNLNKGSIKLGLPPMIGAYLFPNIFFNFTKAYPNLNLQVFEEGSISTRLSLEKGQLDIGIIILPEVTNNLNVIPIKEEEIVLCVSPQHKLAKKAEVSFAELKNENFILLKKDSFHRQAIIKKCSSHNYKPHIVFSSSQIDTIRGLVSNGVGISFLMNMVAQHHKNLVGIPLKEKITITIGLAWKKDKYLSRSTKVFINFLKDYINLSLENTHHKNPNIL